MAGRLWRRGSCLPWAASAGLLLGSAACRREADPATVAPLLCLVGGTMRPAMEEFAKRHEAKTGRRVEFDFGDSGQLMAKIQETGRGDLYVCHDPFLAALMKRGLGERGWTVAALEPMLLVAKGNPKGIRGFRDLARPGVRIVLPDAEYSTAGHILDRVAAKAGIAAAIASNTVTRTRGGAAAANAVALGSADAAVAWNAVGHLRRDKLDSLPFEADLAMKRDVDAVTTATYGRIEMDYVRVTVATLKGSRQPAAAREFAEYLASSENRSVWLQFGYSPTDPARETPAPAAGRPDLLVHCAAGMRVPIASLAERFERDRGVRVTASYDGSNRLLGQIKLSRRGDVYIAGDADYVDMAAKEGLVSMRRPVGYFVPVILVAKTNPKGVRSLADLLRPGMRVGQGDAKASAIGRIVPKLLESNGVDATAWRANVVLETPTVNELGLAVKLGTVDAVVVWDAVAASYTQDAVSVAIPKDRNHCPAVEAAVLTTTTNAELAESFLAFLVSETGRRTLRESGYTVEKP